MYFLHFSTDDQQEVHEMLSDTLARAVEEQAETLIYYVNTDTIWERYEYVQDVLERLEGKRKQYESQMDSRLREFEREVMEFQQSGRGMSEVEMQIKQRDLMEKESKLGELKNDLETRFIDEEKEWNDKIRKKIIDFIENETSDLKYHYILSYSLTSDIVLANDSLNLTDRIVRGLNEEYRDKKANTE